MNTILNDELPFGACSIEIVLVLVALLVIVEFDTGNGLETVGDTENGVMAVIFPALDISEFDARAAEVLCSPIPGVNSEWVVKVVETLVSMLGIEKAEPVGLPVIVEIDGGEEGIVGNVLLCSAEPENTVFVLDWLIEDISDMEYIELLVLAPAVESYNVVSLVNVNGADADAPVLENVLLSEEAGSVSVSVSPLIVAGFVITPEL